MLSSKKSQPNVKLSADSVKISENFLCFRAKRKWVKIHYAEKRGVASSIADVYKIVIHSQIFSLLATAERCARIFKRSMASLAVFDFDHTIVDDDSDATIINRLKQKKPPPEWNSTNHDWTPYMSDVSFKIFKKFFCGIFFVVCVGSQINIKKIAKG